MSIRSFLGLEPRLAEGVFIAENAMVIGDVEIGEGSSIWYGAVIRGDVHRIRIGRRTNIQDGSVLHVGSEGFPLTIGDEVVVGHQAVLHGCTIGQRCLVGIGARILNGAVIGDESIVAAGAVVVEGTRCPPRTLLAGIPAKPRREVRQEDVERILRMARRYQRLAGIYLGTENDLEGV